MDFSPGSAPPPPTAGPLCLCDRYTSNQCPYYRYVTMHITISYYELLPTNPAVSSSSSKLKYHIFYNVKN